MRGGWIVGVIMGALVVYYGLIPFFFPNFEIEVHYKSNAGERYETSGDFRNEALCREAGAAMDRDIKSGKVIGWTCRRKPLPLIGI